MRGLSEYRISYMGQTTLGGGPLLGSVPALAPLNPGGNGHFLDVFSGNRPLQNRNTALKRKHPRDQRAIFPTRLRSFNGSRFLWRDFPRFSSSSWAECAGILGAIPTASKASKAKQSKAKQPVELIKFVRAFRSPLSQVMAYATAADPYSRRLEAQVALVQRR